MTVSAGANWCGGVMTMPLVQVTRTYLEMTSPAEQGETMPPAGFVVQRVEACPPSFFRYLYTEVGRPHHWSDRLGWSDDRIREYLGGPITFWVAYAGGVPAGYFELKRGDDGSVEIAYFGLLPDFVGVGLGKALLARAVREAWALGPKRVWLHTCTLDHPSALPNYLKRGFRPIRQETYVAEVP